MEEFLFDIVVDGGNSLLPRPMEEWIMMGLDTC